MNTESSNAAAEPSSTRVGTRHDPRVLILMAGPKFDLEWEFGCRLSGLSRFSEGYLIVPSTYASVIELERFHVLVTAFDRNRPFNSLRSRIAFIHRCFSVMRAAKREGRPIELIVTYDPLATGVIGWALTALFGAKLICEVNGDYAANANFMHVRSPRVRAVKSKLAGCIARFVLSRADGVRILYKGQLAQLGYVARPDQIVMQYGEFVNTVAFRDLGEESIVLLVGFPFYVKGVDVAINAFKEIAADYPDWHLKILGHYPDDSGIRAAIDGHAQISHHKPVPNWEMNEHIGRCGIVLQTSRTEAMGRVLVEAMAAGKPRVASNVGGIPTVVEDGLDGILVESEDVGGFARALEALMSQPELRRAMGAAGVKRAADELGPEVYFGNVESLFRAVAAD